MIADFRSDTVTKPTPGMLEAMHRAKVGDDVFEDDPTVNELQSFAAELFGREAALFCPSGTMTNQIAIKVHTQPGDEVVCDQLSHIYNYEGGGIASNSGCSVRLMRGERGRYTAADVEASVLPDDPHFPRTSLVSVENTSNKGGGAIWNNAEIAQIRAVCDSHNLKFHLDGARLFNALVETGQTPVEVGATFDSISICLSKGLGCPVGSLVIGDADFIHQARRVRKAFGGGMRQAGYIAAAGLYALNHQVQRLKDDHALARQLEAELLKQHWVSQVIPVETNIVVAELIEGLTPSAAVEQLQAQGVLAVPFGSRQIRFVTHLDIDEELISFTFDTLPKLKC